MCHHISCIGWHNYIHKLAHQSSWQGEWMQFASFPNVIRTNDCIHIVILAPNRNFVNCNHFNHRWASHYCYHTNIVQKCNAPAMTHPVSHVHMPQMRETAIPFRKMVWCGLWEPHSTWEGWLDLALGKRGTWGNEPVNICEHNGPSLFTVKPLLSLVNAWVHNSWLIAHTMILSFRPVYFSRWTMRGCLINLGTGHFGIQTRVRVRVWYGISTWTKQCTL